ncbi:PepSY domain-containing protein [Plantibacter sp. Leaf314]|uniref:PepSY-associated TM helix domain-containing protein n=1 Tax=Plantibacter sp. Leaf314 TaxID=1736333 RepID=UPI0006F9090E|nr:PepSY-associated TM helix domain-containing protein [Plantibacter sp. Leaf314]KQQ51371.1 peptidase [Plantibacter sp. Leaf314]
MTTMTRPPVDEPHADGPPPKPNQSRGWFPQLLLRLHFYAAIFVGPFILVAATSGALYALTPQLEQLVYAEQLHAPEADEYLPLADQIEAANAYTKGQDTIVAVRPAPNPGDTTRVMYTGDGLGESETRAVFVDPATAQIRGDLTAYGTSGALPLRTWIDQLHRNLHLGEVGRLYSELAASWLGVIALAGLGLWIARIRKARTKKYFVRPNNRAKGYRRILSWHTSTGIWLFVGALFLSATGITWSQYGGGNVGTIRAAFDWSTPSVTTDLSGESAPADEHAGHSGHGGGAAPTSDSPAVTANPATFDAVLSIAREVNVNTGLVEIKPPATAGTAWVVQEIQRSFPTEVDAVAIDGQTMQVTDRVDFKDFNLAAKLTRWGIDTHMGSMFGLPNQLLLFALASGIIAMVVWGYVMWWQRRPTREPGRIVGRTPARGALRRAPWWGIVAVLVVAAGIGTLLPLLGISLAAFVVVDVLIGLRHRKAA